MNINLNEKKIDLFCKKHHVVFLGLFGSGLTPRFTDASDIDVLVKFDKKHIPTLFDMFEMENELTFIMGRTVDLKTPNDLSPYFRHEVKTKAKIIYGR